MTKNPKVGQRCCFVRKTGYMGRESSMDFGTITEMEQDMYIITRDKKSKTGKDILVKKRREEIVISSDLK